MITVLAGAAAAGLAACGGGAPSPSGTTEARSAQVRVTSPVLQEGDLATLVADDGRFAWDLYQAVRATPGNLAFSPASLSLALAMAYGGAALWRAAGLAQVVAAAGLRALMRTES